jgi:hypothetical protein
MRPSPVPLAVIVVIEVELVAEQHDAAAADTRLAERRLLRLRHLPAVLRPVPRLSVARAPFRGPSPELLERCATCLADKSHPEIPFQDHLSQKFTSERESFP